MKEETTRTGDKDRKQDHLDLAFEADMGNLGTDSRFRYEPMLAAHPDTDLDLSISFLGKKLAAPLWVSSMTGGTEMALMINQRLAASCAKFGLGMGLGSCRPLLDNLTRLNDFDVREIIGPELPLYANLGIAQVEKLLAEERIEDIQKLISTLRADGLVIHVNPLQEWLQPEGDRIHRPPIETIEHILSKVSFPIIVKEVGQGMGWESLAALLALPLEAVELAAHGGTNFSKLELLRSNAHSQEVYGSIAQIGHRIEQMIAWINQLRLEGGHPMRCRQIIISGGIKDFLDGYYWMEKLNLPSIYGQASAFLKYARESQEALDEFISNQIMGLRLAHTYLKVK
ncbi:MAG TPA: isopentenyl-diphosphate delta-isomerase [Saprospiraceae bacterium]|nr:isopentenyl-diphosphate delta-isomerase [Saprospiraceae bacterium]